MSYAPYIPKNPYPMNSRPFWAEPRHLGKQVAGALLAAALLITMPPNAGNDLPSMPIVVSSHYTDVWIHLSSQITGIYQGVLS